ncbi:MAG: hypothetical protein ACRELB_20940, partial [Polyangiaceae bacterium]
TTFLGQPVDIDARDRGSVLALTLGVALFAPPVGDTSFSPLAALYYKRVTPDYRVREQFSIFVNELDLAIPISAPFELVGRIENDTIPFPQTEVVDGEDVAASEVEWGTVDAFAGVGVRFPVAPFEEDSDLRIQAFYHGGWLYTRYTKNTSPDSNLPPDTYVHGARLRIRYDALTRNLLELPHEGIALGMDIDYLHRDRDRDFRFGTTVFKASQTRDVVKVSAYLVAATGIPGLSDRSRLVVYVHGGLSPLGEVDRFDSFRVGGGPFPSETDDLYRHPYPGALFNQVPASEYVLATVEYRLELLFFLYWSVRGTIGWGSEPTFRTGHLDFTHATAQAISTGLTSGFLWNSELYLEVAYDTGEIRNGKDGSSVLFLWSKAF